MTTTIHLILCILGGMLVGLAVNDESRVRTVAKIVLGASFVWLVTTIALHTWPEA